MTTMNILLPETMKAFLDERVKNGGYGSYSEYVRELIRRDEREASAQRLRALLQEGLEAPMGRDVDLVIADMRSRARRSTRR